METGSKDVEQQFLLRLPEDAAESLRKDLENGSSGLRDKLLMEINSDSLKGTVVYDGRTYEAKLYDLPCIIESYKTTNKRIFYKSADISQVLVCSGLNGEETTENKKQHNRMNGLCRPFRGIKEKRFKKIAHKTADEQLDIDKELRRLLASDSQAIDVTYQIVEEEDEHQPEFQSQQTNSDGNSSSTFPDDMAKESSVRGSHRFTCGSNSPNRQQPPSRDASALNSEWSDYENSNNNDDIFGDVSSSDDDFEFDEKMLEEQIGNDFDAFGDDSNSSFT